MRQLFYFLLLNALFSMNITGQIPETDLFAQREISKLSFLVGDWKGTGWMMIQDGTRHSFDQYEKIQLKLDGTALLIEGTGYADGKLIHDALAIVTYNKETYHFDFSSFLFSGKQGKFKAELIDDKLHWYPAEFIRYIIYLNEKGQWYETGEMKRGNDWIQFMEMTLDKM